MAERLYRCENEWGGDPCELALNNKKITSDEVAPSMEGATPKCPGKTQSGKPCSKDLVEIPSRDKSINPKLLMALAGGIAISFLAAILLSKFMDPVPEKDPVIIPPPSPDPWQVYKELETNSTILRGKTE